MPLDYTLDHTEILDLLQKHVKGERFDHSLRVADTAVKLAKLYGVDESKAGLAGLLHDITKQMDNNELKIKYGVGSEVDKTLHGPTAAAWLRDKGYVTDPDVLSAIRFHTTGRASMSMLEKIIYVADAAEPGRKYPEVDKLRQLMMVNIDAAVLFALKRSILELVQTRKSLVDLETVLAYNDYRRLMNQEEWATELDDI